MATFYVTLSDRLSFQMNRDYFIFIRTLLAFVHDGQIDEVSAFDSGNDLTPNRPWAVSWSKYSTAYDITRGPFTNMV